SRCNGAGQRLRARSRYKLCDRALAASSLLVVRLRHEPRELQSGRLRSTATDTDFGTGKHSAGWRHDRSERPALTADVPSGFLISIQPKRNFNMASAHRAALERDCLSRKEIWMERHRRRKPNLAHLLNAD